MILNQVTLPSRNMIKSAEFYKILGLKLIVDSIPRYCRFLCPDGINTLSLHRVEEKSHGPGVVIYFENDNIDAKVKELMDDGIQFLELPTNKEWLWKEASLEDPDGNKIILFEAGENRINPPWRVK